MANFYTYGFVPNAEETVYGLGGLDSYGDFDAMPVGVGSGLTSLPPLEEEPVFVPRDESVPVSPLEQAPTAAPTGDTRSPGPESVADYLASSQPPVSPLQQAPTAAPTGDTRSPGPMPPPGMKVNPNYGQPGEYYYIPEEAPVYTPRGESVPVSPLEAPVSSGPRYAQEDPGIYENPLQDIAQSPLTAPVSSGPRYAQEDPGIYENPLQDIAQSPLTAPVSSGPRYAQEDPGIYESVSVPPLETPPPGPGLAGDDGRVVTQPIGATVPVTSVSAPLSTPAAAPAPSGESKMITPQAPPSPLTLVSGGEGLLGPEEPRVYNPRGENVPVSPLAAPTGSRVVPPEGFPFGTKGSMYVPGSTIPEGVDPLAPIEYTEEQGKAASNALALASLIAPGSFGNMYVGDAAFGGAPISTAEYYRNVASGSVGGQGSLYEEGALEAAKAAAKDPYSSLWGASLKELVAQDPSLQPMVDAKVARELDRIAKVEQDYEQMKPLSDLLKANKFQEAFAYAKEQGIADRLLKADWLSQLRQPFTDEEQQQFYNAIPPDLVGKGWIFDPANAMKRSFTAKGTTPQWMGYPDPGAAFKPKENKSFEKIAMAAGLAMLGAAYLPGLAGAGGAKTAAGAGAGAGAGGAGAGAGAGVGGLSYFKPAGLLAGTTAAKAVPIAATITATGGGLTAAQLAALGAAGVGAGAVSGGGAGAGAGTAPATTTPPPDNLQEILVQATKPKPYSLLGPGTLASTSLIQGTPDVPVDIYGRPQGEPDLTEGKIEAAEQVQPLEEFIVRAPSVLSPLEIAAGAAVPALSQMLPKGSFGQSQTIKEPTATEKQLDKIQKALKTGAPIPGTLAARIAQLSELADRLGGIDKLLKVLGALGGGAAVARRPSATAPMTGAGGFGGALPKFQLQRTQLQPQVDYYRYGLGPEARFFEDKMVPVETTEGPTTGIVNPKDRPPVFAEGGLAAGGRYMEGPGSGRDDKIPALLSDGEYVIDAETLALLGDGSTKEGARKMDKFRAKIRKHKGRALSRGRISPNAKSPDKYMGGGLT